MHAWPGASDGMSAVCSDGYGIYLLLLAGNGGMLHLTAAVLLILPASATSCMHVHIPLSQETYLHLHPELEHCYQSIVGDTA
jgi:hypothetical protein